MKRVALLLVLLALLAGATALAQDGGGGQGPYELAEPPVTSAAVIHLPSDAACVHFTRATARFMPPLGAIFGVLQVSVDDRQAVRLTGVPRAASATVRLTGARSRVTATGTTLGGQVVTASRDYRRCSSSPTPKPRPRRRARPAPVPEVVGGGDEG